MIVYLFYKNYDGVGYEMDIWALGVIWYYMHAKVFPFESATADSESQSEENIELKYSQIAKKIKEMNPDYSLVDPYVSKILKQIFVNVKTRIKIPVLLKLLN